MTQIVIILPYPIGKWKDDMVHKKVIGYLGV